MRRPSTDGALTRPGDGIGVVTLSNPAACNALTSTMWAELDLAFRQLIDDPRVLVIVIRGQGNDFSSGADPGARLGVTASRLGIVYPDQPTRRLVDLVGAAETRRLLYAGELLDAPWALRVGLITEIVPTDVDRRALEFARLLTTHSQTSIAAAKRALSGQRCSPGRSGSDHVEHTDHSDYVEGVSAFRERRQPRFPSASAALTGSQPST